MRDSESGLDYAMNRFSQSTMGRLTSVDKGPMLLHLPRSLNRYLYTMDDPINRIDPDGNQGTLVVTVTGEMPPLPPLMEMLLRVEEAAHRGRVTSLASPALYP